MVLYFKTQKTCLSEDKALFSWATHRKEREFLPPRNFTSLGKFRILAGLGTHEICTLAVAVFVSLCHLDQTKMAQNLTCTGQTLLHETQSIVIHPLKIFIKELQGKCMDNYCLCSRTKFTPFMGLKEMVMSSFCGPAIHQKTALLSWGLV